MRNRVTGVMSAFFFLMVAIKGMCGLSIKPRAPNSSPYIVVPFPVPDEVHFLCTRRVAVTITWAKVGEARGGARENKKGKRRRSFSSHSFLSRREHAVVFGRTLPLRGAHRCIADNKTPNKIANTF